MIASLGRVFVCITPRFHVKFHFLVQNSETNYSSVSDVKSGHDKWYIFFRHVPFILNYECSSDEDDKEEGTPVLPEANLRYKSMWTRLTASWWSIKSVWLCRNLFYLQSKNKFLWYQCDNVISHPMSCWCIEYQHGWYTTFHRIIHPLSISLIYHDCREAGAEPSLGKREGTPWTCIQFISGLSQRQKPFTHSFTLCCGRRTQRKPMHILGEHNSA